MSASDRPRGRSQRCRSSSRAEREPRRCAVQPPRQGDCGGPGGGNESDDTQPDKLKKTNSMAFSCDVRLPAVHPPGTVVAVAASPPVACTSEKAT